MIHGHAEVHVSQTRVICDIRCRRGVVRCMCMGCTATQIDDYCLPLHARRSPVVSVHCPCIAGLTPLGRCGAACVMCMAPA